MKVSLPVPKPLFHEDRFLELKTLAIRQAEIRPPRLLQNALSNGSYIYGAGNFGRRVASVLAKQDHSCLGFIDKRLGAPGAEIDGLPVIHPGALNIANTQNRTCIIGIHSGTVLTSEPFDFVKQLHFAEILWNTDLPDALGSEINHFWLTNRNHFIKNFDRAIMAARLLSDNESLEIYYNLLRYRTLSDAHCHPAYNLASQYLPPDLPAFDDEITFVDGGAYNGDTYVALQKAGLKISQWLAFEPDPENFEHLKIFSETTNAEVKLFPYGLSDKTHSAYFKSGEGTGSHLTSNASSFSINCVALDEVINGTKPDFIKLDVEGSENAALDGMKLTIQRHHPRLAISLYHRPDDLWSLILKIEEIDSGYNFYVRQHGSYGLDTVLYAI